MAAIAVALLFAPGAARSQTRQSEEQDRASETHVVTVGEITEVDLETQSFELKSRVFETTRTSRAGGGGRWNGEIHVGVGVGGGGGGGREVRGPFDPPRLPILELPQPGSVARYTTSTIHITPETVITQDGKPIGFDKLQKGDRVIVSGVPEGEDLQAVTIKRQRPILP